MRLRILRGGTDMTVHFIGAGPGAADLLTLRAVKLLREAPICLYAGSIVPGDVLGFCREDARLVDTAPLCLDEIEAEYMEAHRLGKDVARLHSGDLSIYSAMTEQIRRLQKHGIPYTVTPGVPAFAAAAAQLGVELTVPRVAQTVVLTRISGRASPMPPKEQLVTYAETGATLAIHLAIHRLDEIIACLRPIYGGDCPVAIIAHATTAQERRFTGSLATITEIFARAPVTRTAIIFVGRALDPHATQESALYHPDYRRQFRP